MSKKFEIKDGDISDGYHTFDELYDHRCLLYVHICQINHKICSWRPDFEGWFVLYLNSFAGQISYHVPNKYLPLVEPIIPRNDNEFFDGHKSPDVLRRLEQIAKYHALKPETTQC